MATGVVPGLLEQHSIHPLDSAPVQEYKSTFEKMIMEEALAQMMQGSESAQLITPQPSVVLSSAVVRLTRSNVSPGWHMRLLIRLFIRSKACCWCTG